MPSLPNSSSPGAARAKMACHFTHEEFQSSLETTPKLVAACNTRLGSPLNEEELLDVVQETNMVAWRRVDEFEGRSSLNTWLYGIARLTIMGAARKKYLNASRQQELESSNLDLLAENGAATSDLGSSLWGSLDRASRAEGTTVALIVRGHLREGLTLREIGERLKLSLAAVKSRYQRSMPSIRGRLVSRRPELRRFTAD